MTQLESHDASADKVKVSYGWDLMLLKLTWPLLLGNMLEWYEFGVYAYVVPEMQANFFSGSAIETWVGFAVTFVARPFGGFVLGWIADRFGRKISVQLSLGGMIVATVGQGLLPGAYWGSSAQGFGMVMLIILRALQGLSAGGEIATVTAMLMEVAPLQVMGISVCFISVGSQVAWAFASALLAQLNEQLGPEQMLIWGWRVPFLLTLFPGLLALWGRNRLQETGDFSQEIKPQQVRAADAESQGGEGAEDAENAGEAEKSAGKWAVTELLTDYLPVIFIGFGASAATATAWFVPPFWILSALLDVNLGATDSLWVGNMSQLVGLAVTPLAGYLTDQRGVAWVTLAGAAFFTVIGLPVYAWISYFPTSRTVAYLGIGLFYGAAQGFAGATIYLFNAELFPARLRCLGLAFSYNLAVSFVGGFGPMICQALLPISPHFAPGIYFSGMGAISVLTVLCSLYLRKRGLVRLTHQRDEPYFGRIKDDFIVPVSSARRLEL
mmetsp:Transcript_29018/g.51947  ORF Transcript_29018/g.51947 Transcript_29018/m.51947 type:complete len:496 (-) Transcript_29018:202-1689(-)